MKLYLLAITFALSLLSSAHAGLVAYWPFNDSGTLGTDPIGGTVLTATGATFTASGKFGGGVALSGTTQFLSGTVNNLPIGNSNYTQSAWFKPTVLGARGIVGWGGYGGTRQVIALRMSDSGNGFSHYWWGADLVVTGLATNFLDGNWHHVATTFDGTTRRIYLNGVQVASDVPGSNGATAANFRIGSTNNSEYFSGTIDDVALYNNALSASEVQFLAAGGSPVAGPSITSFTASPTTAFEGGSVALSWVVNTSLVTGTFSYEIKYGATVLSTGTAATGTFNTVVPDLAGIAQPVTWTLRAIETGGTNVTKTATASVAADPGIPTVTSQSGLTTPPNTPLAITLAGNDPNGGTLTYSIVTPPTRGTVSAGTGAARTYTPTTGLYGLDQFTFRVSDGKYDSALATVQFTVLTPPLSPTSVTLDDLTIRPTNVAGDFLSTISSADPNVGEAHTFTLVGGVGSEENANFSIVGHQLRAAVSFAGLTGVPQRIRIRSTDASGLTVEASFVLTVVAKVRGIVINEIHYNSAVNNIRNPFIELYNDGPTTVNLTSWRLSGEVDYLFPAGTMLAPNAYLVIAEDPATILSYWGKTALGPWDNATVTYPDGSKESNNLSNDGGTVRLRNAANVIVAEVDYGNHSPWPAAGNGDGSSIELLNPALDATHGSNWAAAKGVAGPAPNVTYVAPATSGWKYFKGTTAPSATWKDRTGADITGWLDGTTTVGNATSPFFGFGYADADDAVVLSDMQQAGAVVGYQAVYFRKEFELVAGQIPSALEVRAYVDDGCIVYINGVEIPARFFCGAGTPTHAVGDTVIGGVAFANHEAAPNNWATYTVNNLAPYNLVAGTNVIAILAANDLKTSSDFSFNLELKKAVPSGEVASPGAQNLQFTAIAAPAIRNVTHTPAAPTSSDAMIITARITDPQGVASASLAYQLCTAGNYIPSTLPKTAAGGHFADVLTPLAANPAFELPANWTTIAMNDDGTGVDVLGGDGIWTASIPPQANRTLVRYRITTADNLGASARVPYLGDPSLNFACFVYNGVPAYEGTSAADLQTMPVYHFLTRKADFDQCVAYDANLGQRLVGGTSWNFENWEAAFVCNGVVYDHIPYRLKGANGRYTASGTGGVGNGKRAFKFYFNKGYEFDAIDQAGNPYPEKWSTMITENTWENRATHTFSINEQLSFDLLNQLGVPSPRGHWSHFRTIMQSAEQPDKWHGDFWGLMWVHQDYDRRFLKAHNLKKGNLYKLTRDGTSGLLQFRYQSTFGPTDGSDHDEILANLKGTSTPAYITGRVNLDLWCRYHAFAEAIRHYDYWPNGDNNGAYYFYPNYNAGNGNKGQLWYLPNDLDATWGPTWNGGHDIVHNSLFNDSASGGGDVSTNPTLWPNYFNQVREIRALLWQPGQLNALIDEYAAVVRPIANAEFIRWHPSNGAPADSGNFGGLFGPNGSALNAVGQTALDLYIAGMKDFAFDENGGGSTWPGGNVGVGGRAAFLDTLGSSLGENSTIYPATPTITFSGSVGFPVNDLRFTTSAFSDPQGAGTFAGIQWRIAEVNPSPTWVAGVKRLLEINARHESGTLATFGSQYRFPAASCEPGKRYRARVRMQDNTGRWSLWSAPSEFTASAVDTTVLAQNLVISEIMYHSANPTPAEQSIASGLGQVWDDDSFDYIELRNISGGSLDIGEVRFSQGVNFTFPVGATLAANATVLIVHNTAAFNARYGGGKPIAGAWVTGNKLSNGGDQLNIKYGDAALPFYTMTYDDIAPWPLTPDGSGPSLVLLAPETRPNPSVGSNWRASYSPGGNPGGDDRPSFATWATVNVVASASGDEDGDGISNLLEYGLFGNPNVGSQSPLPTSTNVGGFLTLTVRRLQDPADINYFVEFTDNFATPFAAGGTMTGSVNNGDGTLTQTWRAPTAGPQYFGRVKVIKP